VWSEHDRIFPIDPFAQSARQRVPCARHLVLNGVGHVPMLDNPVLVATTIFATVARVTLDRSETVSQT
jgi:pimeloyl-ACP methyl ester carboxylesterase